MSTEELTVAAIEPADTTSSLVVPGASIGDIVDAMGDYQMLCQALLDDSDWQTIRGKRFPKRSAWRKLAVAYGVSFQIVDRQLSRDDEGNLVGADFIVRATAPNGRYADGWGAASVTEKSFGSGAIGKAYHDIPATAETRAKNRAAADLFGMGEVSAEEVDRSAMQAPEASLTQLRERLDELSDDRKDDLRLWWKGIGIPAFPNLTREQVEAVESKLDADEQRDVLGDFEMKQETVEGVVIDDEQGEI
jgi:hypothetical protein